MVCSYKFNYIDNLFPTFARAYYPDFISGSGDFPPDYFVVAFLASHLILAYVSGKASK